MTRAQLDKKMAEDKKKEEAKLEGKSDVFERVPSYQVHPCSFSTRRASMAHGASWGRCQQSPSFHTPVGVHVLPPRAGLPASVDMNAGVLSVFGGQSNRRANVQQEGADEHGERSLEEIAGGSSSFHSRCILLNCISCKF